MESIADGQILYDTVSKITNFGAFINLGEIDGLLHISDVAWHRIEKLNICCISDRL
ncbi:hypothetical protein AGMMS49573_04760 [Endomicrobiia bacterium]|uniref:S1 RNA-binding domain-containing protein n=1 Tax=Endomicrobium trichonymphae TaxID=1408204 RepID=UPI0003221FBB|nr:S1 RNA-binding domain-containing protein [Candidatus Endomicrobium trichonymphae]GHT09860.1 hypothetical protein AGMMS49532_08840 [Endomicrobiia bacterium]GHT16129.1 hypothetical protein AGMMS49573_04760 [Endomicrobiia bacterium]